MLQFSWDSCLLTLINLKSRCLFKYFFCPFILCLYNYMYLILSCNFHVLFYYFFLCLLCFILFNFYLPICLHWFFFYSVMSILLINPLKDFFISDIMFLITSIHSWLFLWFISFFPSSPSVHACCSPAVLDFATYLTSLFKYLFN